MKVTNPPGTISLKEAAPLVAYSVMHLQRLCAADKVPHTRRGACYFFTADHLKAIYPEVQLPASLKVK